MRLFWSLSLGALLLAYGARAEIVEWVDEQGRLHFAEDWSRVPPEHRERARERGAAGSDASGSYQQLEFSSPGPAARSPEAQAGAATRVHRIAVQRAGTRLLVEARLDNHVTAPFLIDTGASEVVIPQAVAAELGLDLGPGTRTMVYATANGMVEQPVVTLRSVELGGARVENVPASVSASMPMGLLGLSFFNHFTYEIDTAQGIVTLIPNDLAETGTIRGGRSESQWRTEFANLRARIAALEAEHERTPSSHSRKRAGLEAEIDALERQLEDLDGEAYAAGVPVGWRD